MPFAALQRQGPEKGALCRQKEVAQRGLVRIALRWREPRILPASEFEDGAGRLPCGTSHDEVREP